MGVNEIMAKLDEASKPKYYKFTYNGDGRCKICPQYNGKVFPEDKLPQTHPNCKCAKLTSDPVDISMGKFSPSLEYFIGKNNFNDSRRKLETIFGKQIDTIPHSEPQYKLSDMIKRDGYVMALYRHLAIREDKRAIPYLDGKFIPTIGIGINMTEETNIRKLLNMKAISPTTADILRKFKNLNEYSRQREIERLQQQIKLNENQMMRLFAKSFTVARNDAQSVLSKGKWVKQKDKNGKVYMAWDDNAIDNTTWQKMPDLVKAVCVDLSFNLGKQRMGKYKSFIKAVKAEDYRRAALELVNSGDYLDNIKTDPSKEPKNPGLARRRRDAAIELTELAEKIGK